MVRKSHRRQGGHRSRRRTDADPRSLVRENAPHTRHRSNKRRSLHTPQTNRVVNIAASYQLEKSVSKRVPNALLPTLDAAIAAIVDEAEDEAPLAVSVNLLESVRDGELDSDSVGSDSGSDSEDSDQLIAAQRVLYSDWKERDQLLQK